MASEEDKQAEPAANALSPEVDLAYAAPLSAITDGYRKVEEAMQTAQDAVAEAVRGASDAVRFPPQPESKPDA